MKKWLGGLRGALLLIGLWTVGWGLGFGGIMELVDPDGRIQDVWPTVLAIPGSIGGIIFALLKTFGEGGRIYPEIPVAKAVLWGAIAGFALGLLSIPAEVGDISPGAVGMIGIGIVLGAISGLGTSVFCRLAFKAFSRDSKDVLT